MCFTGAAQVEPYFKGADGAEAPHRPVTEGDVIQLQVGTQLAEFKVVETEPPRHCIVSPETEIDMEEEPLERSAEEVPPSPRCRTLPHAAARCRAAACSRPGANKRVHLAPARSR